MFPQIFGKYVLERELASGGMARVYLATLRGAVGFEKRLVVKQIRPELSQDEAFVRRFVEEAKIAVELSHPNIVPVYELGVELGIYYIAMELCEGLTLTEVLMETGPLDAAEGAHVGIEICRALDYAHRRGGIVHRDVTPRNVLLDEEGAVRLIDFGIAAPHTGTRASERIEVFGSPGHMPPEQISGERLTPATDVFAVGALLLEAWTGRPPFRRSTFEASADALNEPPPDLAGEHAELASIADVIVQAVARRASDRPQDAETLARRLRDFSRPFDSGDVAKRIGARVQRARRRLRSSLPWLPGESSGPLTPAASPQALLSSRPPGGPRTPATPPMPATPTTPVAPVTQTFAARNDLVEWTRKIASVPPAAREPSSASEQPPHVETARPPRSPLPSSPPSVIEADDLATRAMPRSKAPAERRSSSWLAALAALTVVATAAVVSLGGGRARSPVSASDAPIASPPPNVEMVAAAPVAPGALSGQLSSAPALLQSAPLPSARTPSAPRGSVGVASLAAASEAPAASALLKLTADPQATVTVVGPKVSETHTTPVRALKLPAGSYAVTFRSATFGDPVMARVELAPAASRSVHADFRAALPTVVVR